ncbi:MAG: DNA polymerase III subunit alpha, partial [Rhodospirillaceae bacterium]|nr:DNA polymerase III subunit alpha [Rhodospirillaceae bacterium]
PSFVHLRVHTPYSLLEGAVKIPGLVSLATGQGMPALAITDTGNMFGVLEFSAACAKQGLQPIIGTLLALRTGDNAPRGPEEAERVVLLAQNEAGYNNLLDLVSKSFLESEPGDIASIEFQQLDGRSDGLICLTGGANGPVGRRLLEARPGEAEATLVLLKRLFPDRLYVEIQRHDMPGEHQSEAEMIDLAYSHDLPLVATNDVMFTDGAMFEAHDALSCIAGGATVNRKDRHRVSDQHYFKSAEEMAYLFADLPEAIANTQVIARRCAVMSPKRGPILPPYPSESGADEEDELRRQAAEGLEQRLKKLVFTPEMNPEEREAVGTQYRDRLEFELGVIANMKFPGYFLIVADFIQWAKLQGIPVGPGRGSGAGSVVAWSLTITNLDPIKFGLLFERFLNPERISMPDFDIDFCQDRRDEVITYVQQRYGEDRVAQIITFGTLQARAVVRDVGRVLEMPYGQVDRLAKMVPANPANPISLQQALDSEEALQEARNEPEVAHLIDLALKLEGLFRHASTHAAGVVIGDRPLHELIPLYRDPRSDMPVSQFHMKDVEKAGLVKFDFLGLKTLTVLQRAVELLADKGVEIDLDKLPLDDPATYAMLTRAETVGVFQLEGQGMRDALRQLRPDTIEDIIALVSLYRPGPMDNIPSFCNRKHGREEIDFLHPTLEPVLKETYGVIIYQEQVMQIAQILAGYSLGEADILRRAMGKKDKVEMAAQSERFVSGAVELGVDEQKAHYIFELVDKFAGYGFNKSHAAAYAVVAYQTAWLKANHPVEFLAASMTLDIGTTDKLNIFKQELDRLQIPLLQPDVNHSGVAFTVERPDIGPASVRYALAAVKNVGAAAMADLVAECAEKGPFKDLFDFACRLDHRVMNKRQIENLARAGAFDTLNDNRAQVAANVDMLVRFNAVIAEEKESQQENLFGGGGETPSVSLPVLTEVEPWISADELKEEFEAIGFHLSAHPLEPYGASLEQLGVVTFAEAAEQALAKGGLYFKLAGVPVSRRERTSGGGNRFAFAVVSDLSGSHEIVLFSEVLTASRELLDGHKPLLIEADVRVDGETVKFSARRISSLDEAAAGVCDCLQIDLSGEVAVERLQRILDIAEDGRGRIMLAMADQRGQNIEISLPGRFALSPGLRAQLEALPGVEMVADRAAPSRIARNHRPTAPVMLETAVGAR